MSLNSNMKKIALIALIVANVGLFLPFVTANVWFVSVSKNFIDGDGVIVLVLSIIAAILLFTKKNIFPLLLNIASLVVTIIDMVNANDIISGSEYGNYIKVEYGMGCWLLLIGLIVSIICLLFDKKNNEIVNTVNNYQPVPDYSTMTNDISYTNTNYEPINQPDNTDNNINNDYQPKFYCSNCGVELSNEGSFCPNCGVKKS